MLSIHALVHRLHNVDLASLFIRLAIGIVFFQHGWTKLQSMEGTVAFFGTLGFAPFLAYFVAWLEVAGGIAFIAGIFSRYFGILLAITMAVAVFKVHLANGFSVGSGGYEFALVLMLGSLAIVCLGSGRYSLAGLLKGRSAPPPMV